jgi:uncharacterized protein (DUF1499 family)
LLLIAGLGQSSAFRVQVQRHEQKASEEAAEHFVPLAGPTKPAVGALNAKAEELDNTELYNAKPDLVKGAMGTSRREAIAATLAVAASSIMPLSASAATMLTICPKNANNCYSSKSEGKNKVAPWVWPERMSRDEAIEELTSILGSYPQEGQNDVDAGGWELVEDKLKSEGYQRYEFKSGIGKFAKFFNGGRPFIDDLEVVVGASVVDISSSSRVGDSDFDVNSKRLNFLAAKLGSKGWTASNVKGLR